MEVATPLDAAIPAPPRDLRAELFQNLSAQFTAALNSDASLPDVARKALVELLGFRGAYCSRSYRRRLEKRSWRRGGGR